MPQLIRHIDKIAREKQRDVLFVSFDKDEFPNYDYENYKIRNKIIKWLDKNNIPFEECGEFANENGWESYRGQLYLDYGRNKSRL